MGRTVDQLMYPPTYLDHRTDVLGRHPDLRDGESLVELATDQEASFYLARMAAALWLSYRHGPPPICVPIMRGAGGTMAILREIKPDLFALVAPMTVSTTDGQKRLSQPVVSQAPHPETLANHPVLLVDGVGDTLRTLREAIDHLKLQAQAAGYDPPSTIAACVGVLKEGAAKFAVPELVAAAMLATSADWVVGMSDGHFEGFDLADRFRINLPGVWHIQTGRS